jgi:hypothetical protein
MLTAATGSTVHVADEKSNQWKMLPPSEEKRD